MKTDVIKLSGEGAMLDKALAEADKVIAYKELKGKNALHLRFLTGMDSEKRDKLLSASTSGKNESAKGLMGRLRDILDRGADRDIASISSPPFAPRRAGFS